MGEVTSLKVELPLPLSLSPSVQYQTHKPRAPCQREREVERGSEKARGRDGWFDGCRGGSDGGSGRRALHAFAKFNGSNLCDHINMEGQFGAPQM